MSLLIDHGHLIRLQVRNTGSDEVDDGLHLFLLQAPARLQLHEDRGAAVALLAHECRLARHGQVNPGAVDGPQARDGVGQFDLHGVLVAGIFHELADPQARILGHLRVAAIIVRQSLAGELEACLAQAFGGHHDGVGGRLQVVRNGGCIQRRGDLRLVFGGEVRIEHAVARSPRPQHHRHARGHRRRNADQHQQGPQARGPAWIDHFGSRRRRHSELQRISVSVGMGEVANRLTAACS